MSGDKKELVIEMNRALSGLEGTNLQKLAIDYLAIR